MRLRAFLPTACLAVAFAPTAHAWGAAGHEIIATIAQMHLHPSVLPTLCDILNSTTSPDPRAPECHLAPIAAWADRIRWGARWSAPLHYVGGVGDRPSDTCLFPGPKGWAGRKDMNVLGALRNDTEILGDWVDGAQGEDDDRANEALKFLVHFLGDMHMPLHLTGRDRGGNSVQVQFDGRHTNLHSLWDGLLIAKHIRSTPYNYTAPLPIPGVELNLRGAIYDPYIRRIMWEGLLRDWKLDVPAWLACPESSSSSAWKSVLPKPIQTLLGLFSSDEDNNNNNGTDDDTVCPFHWAQPIHELNCALIWPPALDKPPYSTHRLQSSFSADAHHVDEEGHCGGHTVEEDLAFFSRPRDNKEYLELDTPEYAGVIEKERIIEKLLAQGGIRLAGVLNYLFATEEELARGGLSIAEL